MRKITNHNEILWWFFLNVHRTSITGNAAASRNKPHYPRLVRGEIPDDFTNQDEHWAVVSWSIEVASRFAYKLSEILVMSEYLKASRRAGNPGRGVVIRSGEHWKFLRHSS